MIQVQESNAQEFYIYDTPAFSDAPFLHETDPFVIRDGREYILFKRELIPDKLPGITEYHEESRTVTLEDADTIPELAEAELYDASAGETGEGTYRITGIEPCGEHWSEEFSFPILITDYDADEFVLGEVRIDSTGNLIDYSEDFLKLLGLSKESYRILDIEWDGDRYEEGGHMMRRAMASGQKLMTDYRVTYGGDVTWPERDGWHYRCTYKLKSEPEAIISAVEPEEPEFVITVPERESFLKRLIKWLTERKTAVISIIGILAIGLNILLVLLYKKRRDKEKSERWDEP